MILIVFPSSLLNSTCAFSEMTELINNNNSNLVDKSNNCLHSSEETRDGNKLPETRGEGERKSCRVEREHDEEEEYTIRIPFFSLQQYKEGGIRNFDQIIG